MLISIIWVGIAGYLQLKSVPWHISIMPPEWHSCVRENHHNYLKSGLIKVGIAGAGYLQLKSVSWHISIVALGTGHNGIHTTSQVILSQHLHMSCSEYSSSQSEHFHFQSQHLPMDML